MTRPLPSEIVSSWIIDEHHAGIVHAHRGAYRFLVETRVGRVPCIASDWGYSTEEKAVRAMFRRVNAEPPAIASRRTRKTPASWSRIEE